MLGGMRVGEEAKGPRATLWVFRVVATLAALAAIAQPVIAGLYLSGDYDALAVHATNASITGGLCIAQLIAAIVYWRAGRGPGWPAAVALVLVAAVVTQLIVGYQAVLAVHIPLGVAGVVALACWVWRPAAGRSR
jgi:hypothetical protein